MSQLRFLLVTLSNIGDAVLTTPVLEALHRLQPQALVDIVADSRSSDLFRACPYVGTILHKDKHLAMRGMPALVKALRQKRYDLVVDLRTDFLPLLLRARRRLFRWQGRASGPHAVQRHLGVLRPLMSDTSAVSQKLWLRAGDLDFARTTLGGHASRRLLMLGPGANWSPKIWPASSFVELVHRVVEAFDAVVLLGGNADRSAADAIASKMPLPCLNLAGTTGLPQAAAVLSHGRVFVGNDSGLGHMAAALKIPTLTLFGPGDPERYHPWGEYAAWLSDPRGDVAAISVDRAQAELERLLSRTPVATRAGAGA